MPTQAEMGKLIVNHAGQFFYIVAIDQLTDGVSRVVMSLFNSSEVAFLTSWFF